MATGTGNLPYQDQAVSPFDTITAQFTNETIANIESLADGTGLGDGSVTVAKLGRTTHMELVTISTGANVISDLPFTPNTVQAILINTHASDTYSAHGGAHFDGTSIFQSGSGTYRNSAGTSGITVSSVTSMLSAAYWSTGIKTDFSGTVSGLGVSNSITITATNVTSNLSKWLLTFSR